MIAGSKDGVVIVWDLPTATTQFAVRLARDRITDILFLNENTAMISSTDGSIITINFRLKTIENGVSEGRPRKAMEDHVLGRIELQGKVLRILKAEERFFAILNDQIVLLNGGVIKARSQNIVKGIIDIAWHRGRLLAGCADGSVRALPPGL